MAVNEIDIFTASPSLKHWPATLAVAGFLAATAVAMFALLLLSLSAALLLLSAALALIARPVLTAGNTEYVATSHRLIRRRGLLKKREQEIVLSRLSDIRIDWGTWGRSLGVGALEIEGAGERMRWDGIEDPEKVRARILSLK